MSSSTRINLRKLDLVMQSQFECLLRPLVLEQSYKYTITSEVDSVTNLGKAVRQDDNS